MAAELLDGRALAHRIRDEVTRRTAALREKGAATSFAIIVAEGDEPGLYYAGSLEKSGAACGMEVDIVRLPDGATTADAVRTTQRLSADPAVHGIIIQRPLPPTLDAAAVSNMVAPHKDVDGAHPLNIGSLAAGGRAYPPATAAAVMELLSISRAADLRGANVVVLGRSLVVGKPVAMLLLAADATVTICHSHTKDLARVCRRADVLIAAIGKPQFVTGDYVRAGAVVIDVGTNVVDGKLLGDIDAESVGAVAGQLTPVPGGVGPVTTAVLLRHVVESAERSQD